MATDPKKQGNFGNTGRGSPKGENQGGGPKTPAGLERAKANLQPWAPTTHGLFTWTTRGIGPPCDKCPMAGECDRYSKGGRCVVAAEKLQAIVAQIMAEPHIQDSDLPQVVEYARCVVGLDIASLHLDQTGPYLPGAEAGLLDVQPAQNWRLKLAALQLKYADALGLSPAARLKLKIGAGADPVKPGASWARAVIEAEFEEEPHGDSSDGDGRRRADHVPGAGDGSGGAEPADPDAGGT